MAKPKTQWLVTYWDDNLDAEKKVGTYTYEEAQVVAAKVMRKFNRSASITYKGK